MGTETLLLNAAYVVYVAAGTLRGTLALRIGLVLTSVAFCIYGLVAGNMSLIGWNVAFGAFSLYHAISIIRANSVTLTPEQEHIRAQTFPTLSAREFLLLWTSGRTDDLTHGDVMCVEATPQNDLFYLIEGEARITSAKGLDIVIKAPTFIGEMSFYSGETASADVVATTDGRMHQWNQNDLRGLRTLDANTAGALQAALGRDIAQKLRA